MAGFLCSSPLASASPAPALTPIAVSAPTHLPPGGEGKIVAYVQNVGGAPSTGPITVESRFPSELTPSGPAAGLGWECYPAGPDAVACVSSQPVPPGATVGPIVIPVDVGATPDLVINEVTVSGGGSASPEIYEQPVTISATPAEPGSQVFTAGFHEGDGAPSVRAGSHPYAATFAVLLNTVETPFEQIAVPADVKTIAIGLPPGLFSNPAAIPGCAAVLQDPECPLEAQAGIVQVIRGSFDGAPGLSPVHSAQAPRGYTAKFSFSPSGLFPVSLLANLSSDDYRTTVELPNAPQMEPFFGVFLTLWGIPADPLHDDLRCELFAFEKIGCGPSAADPTAFLTLPADCSEQAARAPLARLSLDMWQSAGDFEYRQRPLLPVSDCEHLSFGTDFTFDSSTARSESPASFEARLAVPSGGLNDPGGLATPSLEKAVIELPPGATLNASVADGLATCSEAQMGLRGTAFPPPNRIRFSKAPNQCPDAAKVGTAELETPLLRDSLAGVLYLAAQNEGNPLGSPFAIYLVVEDAATGTVIKLPGGIVADDRSGQLTLTLDELPQLPFTSLRINLMGGDRSLLATPSTCGEFAAVATSTPWSAPESGPPVVSEDGLAIDSAPSGESCARTLWQRPFAPGFRAGATSAFAGSAAPFAMRLTRTDGEQELDRVSVALPPGVAADLKGVATCSGAALAARSCPEGSQVGKATVGVGVGPTPYYLSDARIYLAGPYKGAPFSFALVLPVQAGPFDLGAEVVRMALWVESETGRISIESDPLPQIVEGVPTKIRDVRIDLDRPGFMRNPTNCEPSSVAARIEGASGAVANRSVRFQVGGCEGLGFKPRLSVRLSGAPPRRGGHPAMTAVLRGRPGDAGIRRASILLPETELLENANIRGVCPRARFAAGNCPPRSAYGEAAVWSPLLDEPLRGPVYLRTSDGRLPDLVAALDGQLRLDLAASVDSVGGRVRTTFEGLPDIPVSRLALTLDGGRRGLLVNNTRLCRARPRAAAFFRAHNEKVRRVGSAVRVEGCGQAGRGRR